MKKLLSSIVVLCLCVFPVVTAQNNNSHNVSGQTYDEDLNEPLPIAAIQILSLPDSSLAKGTISDNDGRFTSTGLINGNYLIKISYLGYRPYEQEFTLTSSSPRDINLGKIMISTDAKLLAEAVITAEVPKVQAILDTLVFNSAAYRLSEGSSIQELIKKLPGVDIDGDGKITVNGKAVSQILINGKEYLGDDINTLLENLPANMIDRLKTYEKKSDLARITGIDDGEENTVFDLQIKKEMNGGLLNTYDLAYGSDWGEHNLYKGQVMMNRFTDNNQFTLYGNASNVIDQGIGNGGRQWGGNRGQNTYQNLSASYQFTADKIEVNGNIGVSHSENDFQQKGSSENFFGARSSFSNSRSKNLNSSNRINSNFYVEWRPDTMTNIIIRPYFNTSKSGGDSESASATFNSNPYDEMDDPLYDMLDAMGMPFDSIFVNRNTGLSSNDNKNNSGGGSIQFNRKLNNVGRNITFRVSGNFSNGNSDNYSYNTTTYFKEKSLINPALDSINIRNRYTFTPSNRYGYSAQAIYSEPIFTDMFLQFSYSFNYSWDENDRQTYAFDGMTDYGFREKPEDYYQYMDSSLSKYASYTTYRHDAQVSLRVIREKYRINTGIRIQPQETLLEYTQKEHYTLRHDVLNWNPTFDFRYMFNKETDLRFRINGSSSQPSMTNLLPITDNSNPLYITMGNPDLKPSFTTNFNIDFHNFNAEKERGFMTFLSYRNTQNSISNRVQYNESTGGSITRPENINGNWNAYGMIGGNFALKDTRYTFNTYTNMNYSNQVGYLYQNNQTIKSTTITMRPSENISASFRDEKFELTLSGNVYLEHSENDIRTTGNLNTWNFTFGASGNFALPWDVRVYYDLFQSSRRGFEDKTFNTDELIWNAQIQKSFLKNKAAIISAQFYDILGQRKNFSRNVSATSKTDNQYNAINQYFMINFTYKLNIFNGKLVQENEGGSNSGDMRIGGGQSNNRRPGR